MLKLNTGKNYPNYAMVAQADHSIGFDWKKMGATNHFHEINKSG